jgi:hypothetical protein
MINISHINEGVPAECVASSGGDGLIVPAARPGSWTRIAVLWHTVIDYLVPIGYEDETGFHYGEMAVSNAAMSLGEKPA